MEARDTFDAIADVYDRVRPGYPDALYSDLGELAALPGGARILELGCGTGKATRGFAERGFELLGLDPGGELLKVAARNLARFPNVVLERTRFEDWPPPPEPFHLVFAAQSFHWIDEKIAFAKSADVLRAGGHLAVFGNVPRPLAPELAAALERVHPGPLRVLAQAPPERWYRDRDPMRARFERSGRFGEVHVRRYPWTAEYDAQAYADLLRSRSAYQMLEAEKRERLIAGVVEAVEALGGVVRTPYETQLYFAPRSR